MRRIKKNNRLIAQTNEEYLINTLALGIATTMLSNATGMSVDYWASFLAVESNRQLDSMSPEQRYETLRNMTRQRAN
jgi:hypothetical protein